MNLSNYPSKLLENAIDEFSKLPGIGRKTALRLVLHMLKQPQENVNLFGNAIIQLRQEVKECKKCHNISDTEICQVCSDKSRDQSLVCVVESVREVLSIENTQQYRGVYHVLGGIISPMDGIGPADLNIETLLQKAGEGIVKEVILALSTTMEGDTTNFFLYRKLNPFNLKVSTLARGVAIGDELEYADEITLGRSIINRTPFVGQ